MRYFSRLLSLSLAIIFLSSTGVSGQEEEDYGPTGNFSAEQLYTAEDFYFLNKNGKRVILEPEPGKIAVQFLRFPDSAVYDQIFGEYGLSQKNWTRVSVNFGAAELKRTVYASQDVFIITLPGSADTFSVLNSIYRRPEVIDAAPVFRLNGELVFPSGIWVNFKYASQREKNDLHLKLLKEHYDSFWKDYGINLYPAGVSTKLNYYRRREKSNTNPLKLSRLIAQDVVALWSMPDFVPVKQPIEIKTALSRPSGTMNSVFEVTYLIKFDPKKIVLDIDGIKGIEAGSIKPKDMPEGFFRAGTAKIDESPGNITMKMKFRMYEPGSFELSPLPVRFNFVGAEKDAVPEVVSSAPINVIVAGLVPRDKSGKPLADDIFGWKKMGRSAPEIPEMPKAEEYPPTDARFYAKGIQLKYPALGTSLMLVSYAIFAVSVFMGLFCFGKSIYRDIRRRQSTMESEYAKTGTAKSAKRYIREILKAPEGKTNHELLDDCPEGSKEALSELLSALDNCDKSGILNPSDRERIGVLLKKLKRGMRWK